MKKIIFPYLLLITLIFSACQEKIDVEKEKQAIIDVLNGETQAWNDKDFDRLASYWVQDEFTRRIGASTNSCGIVNWEEMSANLKRNIETDSLWLGVEDTKGDKSDFNIKVYTNSAWATFAGKESWKYQGEPYSQENIGLAVMEKVEGQWRIAALVLVNESSYETEETAEE
jgi:hypothetical protein